MNKKLSLKDLIWIGTGHVIGAGVVSVVGSALGCTGYSVWIAFLVACVLSFIRILPFIFFTSAVTVDGGKYGMITKCLGMKYGGLISVSSLLNWCARGSAVLALSKYLSEFLPYSNFKLITILIWRFFCFTNLFGINAMSKLQNIASPILLLALSTFSILSIKNIQPGYLDFSSPLMFLNGKAGFFTAVVLLSYSCDGICCLSNYSMQSENPKKNIPLSMIYVSVITTVIYVAVGFASGAVLPLNQTANNTLVITAKYIMPSIMFAMFVIFGPIFALLTTMNSGISSSIIPVAVGAKDGWLPSFLSKENKYGANYISIIIVFIIGILPIIFNFSISQITNMTIALGALSSILILLSALQFPFVFKDEWNSSWLYMSNAEYFFWIFICSTIELFMILKSLSELAFSIRIINIAISSLCILYGIHKFNQHHK